MRNTYNIIRVTEVFLLSETGKKLLYIINPRAGVQTSSRGMYTVVNAFCAAGCDVSVRVTQNAGDACETVKNTGGQYDYIVCSGGDGTLNEVITGLLTLENKPRIGYIPSGSTNDFGTNMGLKKNDFKGGTKRIISGEPFPMDVGLIEGRPFCYVASFGAFTEISYATPQASKNFWGKLAYFLEVPKDLSSIKPIHLKVTDADGNVSEGDYLFGCVSNTFSMAGIVKFENLKVKLDDGKFECMLIRDTKNPVVITEIAAAILSKEFKSDHIDILRSSKFTFEFDTPQDWTLDGEYGPFDKKVTISVAEKAMTIMI